LVQLLKKRESGKIYCLPLSVQYGGNVFNDNDW
jgi:hypothetical protein